MNQIRSSRTNESLDRRVARLAARQYGVISRDQAVRKFGATSAMIQSRLRSGRWERFHRGVFRIAGATPSWRQLLLAACLACGRGAVISHRAAAALWRLPGFAEGPVEVSVPGQRGRRLSFVVRRIASLAAADVTWVDGIPVTKPARTLIDIASREPRDVLEEALDDALRRNLMSLRRLQWRIACLQGSGRPGIALIRSLVEARQGGAAIPQSVFETKLLRLLKQGGVPTPALQHRIPIRTWRGATAVVDFAFPDVRLAIEADGYRWHSGRVRWESDLARRNALTAMGWRVLHVTWSDLTDRASETVGSINAALRQATTTSQRRRTTVNAATGPSKRQN